MIFDHFKTQDVRTLENKLPKGIPSNRYPGRQADLNIGWRDGLCYAWYNVLGEPNVQSDYGVHGHSINEVLSKIYTALYGDK